MYRSEVIYFILSFKTFYLNNGLPTLDQIDSYLKHTNDDRYIWDRMKIVQLNDTDLFDLYLLLITNYKKYREKICYRGLFD